MNCPQLESSLERLFTTVSQPIAEILDHALSGHDITVDEAARLFDADGSDLFAIIAAPTRCARALSVTSSPT